MHRRRFIETVGGVMMAGAASLSGRVFATPATKLVMPSDNCRPTIRQTEGPYLISDSPLRSDVREGQPGVPLKLSLNIVDDFWCTPIKGAAIELWHCDAQGMYSGVKNDLIDLQSLRLTGESVDMRGSSFLRGQQVSGEDGRVMFTTIYPGWYPGRLSHLHLRTTIDGLAWTSHITQLYMPPEVEHGVYQSTHYRERGQNPLGIDRDLVARGDTAAIKQLTIPLEKDGNGLRGEFTLAVTF